nr:U-scoloptoxin(01)-Er1a-like [Cherax quadricarinatus]XP_053633367.1 U-scoloptoxin(01)-Er1a-like [Cherax quadricarinatus]
MKLVVAVVLLCVAVSARMPYVLPDGFQNILKGRPLATTFSCHNRAYGYYADVDNECVVFHVCQPITGIAGEVLEVAHFSFICGQGSIFSQKSLTCAFPSEAFPCSEAPTLYSFSNDGIGDDPDNGVDIIDIVDVRNVPI